MSLEFGLCRCVGEENLAAAIKQQGESGFGIFQIVFTGTAEVPVAMKGGIIDPNKPTTQMATYLLVVTRSATPSPSIDA